VSDKANDRQEGGDHYRKVASSSGVMQHWDRMWLMFREAWFVGNVTKYVERYREKNGVADLKKARHYLDKLIELEEAELKAKEPATPPVFQPIMYITRPTTITFNVTDQDAPPTSPPEKESPWWGDCNSAEEWYGKYGKDKGLVEMARRLAEIRAKHRELKQLEEASRKYKKSNEDFEARVVLPPTIKAGE
jgi:hypothetical protein